MNPQQFLLILRARYRVVLLLMLIVAPVTFGGSRLLQPKYTATATVLSDVRSPDPITGTMVPGLTQPGYMATQVEIIRSDRVSEKVIKVLQLEENPDTKTKWLEATQGKGKLDVWISDRLQEKLDARPSPQSNIINISYTAPDPAFAAAVANAFAQAYIDSDIEMKVDPAKQYARWFEQQGKALRGKMEREQNRLSEYQQKHGIVSIDERLDNETAKLNELSSQLTLVQTQTSDAQSKQRSNASDTLPEIMQNPVITSFKLDIAKQESKLNELAINLGKNHPQYQRQESELASLKQKLEAETQHIASGFATSRSVGKDKETELKANIEAQRNKLLELKRVRNELAVLARDVEAAQRNYDLNAQKFNQTILESQATQSNLAMLNVATAPYRPSWPKPPRIMLLMSILLGVLIGVGGAIVLELLDRRIRSVEDLAETLPFPVLGVIASSKRRARLVLRRPVLARA